MLILGLLGILYHAVVVFTSGYDFFLNPLYDAVLVHFLKNLRR